MRIWDVHPGYLNRLSLLGEHRELHAVAVILRDGKAGYAHHPETVRWRGHGWALGRRHRLLVAEMELRGYRDRSPVRLRSGAGRWPAVFVDPPAAQFELLRRKYATREGGRIPLPETTRQLWAHHKYSVLARDPDRYRAIGREVAARRGTEGFGELALELTELLRRPPPPGRLANAVDHMWGHVAHYSTARRSDAGPLRLLRTVRELAVVHREPYLLSSTALSELAAWLPGPRTS